MQRPLACVFLVLAACGGDAGGGDVPIDQLGTSYATAYCAKAVECCTTDELMQDVGVSNQDQCVGLTGALLQGYLVPALQDGIDHGRIVYHADRMGACIDAMSAMTCDELAAARADQGPWAGCEDPFDPLVAEGGECGSDSDCMTGWCDGDGFDQNGHLTYGTCATLPGAGAACVDFSCTSDAYCDASTQTCAADKPDGSDCQTDDECASGACSNALCGTVCDGV